MNKKHERTTSTFFKRAVVIKIGKNELDFLRKILNNLVIKLRTGEIGILHGADKFVPTNSI